MSSSRPSLQVQTGSSGSGDVVSISSFTGIGDDEMSDGVATLMEILDYAHYLGIDALKEANLLWMAQEALFSELPLGWSEHEDDNGNIYYYSTRRARPLTRGPQTDGSSWENPIDKHYKSLIQRIRDGKLKPPPGAFDFTVFPLPPPWQTFDNDDAHPYYYNPVTKVTQWEHPLEEKLRKLIAARARRAPSTGPARRPVVAPPPGAPPALRSSARSLVSLPDYEDGSGTPSWPQARRPRRPGTDSPAFHVSSPGSGQPRSPGMHMGPGQPAPPAGQRTPSGFSTPNFASSPAGSSPGAGAGFASPPHAPAIPPAEAARRIQAAARRALARAARRKRREAAEKVRAVCLRWIACETLRRARAERWRARLRSAAALGAVWRMRRARRALLAARAFGRSAGAAAAKIQARSAPLRFAPPRPALSLHARQSAWRRGAARAQLVRLRAERSAYRAFAEARQVYATRIAAAFRGRRLRRRFLAAFARLAGAATVLEAAARRRLARRRLAHLRARRELLSACRGRGGAADGGLVLAAALCLQRIRRHYRWRRRHRAAIAASRAARAAQRARALALAGVGPKGGAPGGSGSGRRRRRAAEHDHVSAATEIQRLWRGFRVRSRLVQGGPGGLPGPGSPAAAWGTPRSTPPGGVSRRTPAAVALWPPAPLPSTGLRPGPRRLVPREAVPARRGALAVGPRRGRHAPARETRSAPGSEPGRKSLSPAARIAPFGPASPSGLPRPASPEAESGSPSAGAGAAGAYSHLSAALTADGTVFLARRSRAAAAAAPAPLASPGPGPSLGPAPAGSSIPSPLRPVRPPSAAAAHGPGRQASPRKAHLHQGSPPRAPALVPAAASSSLPPALPPAPVAPALPAFMRRFIPPAGGAKKG
eukprot:tig00021035_g17249.t1